jgi:hypothetical protein
MIAAEKQEHRPGYQQRIATLQKLRQMAEITAKLIRDKRTAQKPPPPPPPKPQPPTDRFGTGRLSWLFGNLF